MFEPYLPHRPMSASDSHRAPELVELVDRVDVLVTGAATGPAAIADECLPQLEEALRQLDQILALPSVVTARSIPRPAAPQATAVTGGPVAAGGGAGSPVITGPVMARPLVAFGRWEVGISSAVRAIALVTMVVVIVWAATNWFG